MITRRNIRQIETQYIRFDRGKCRACWECLKVCPERVFGKISFLFHKHAIIDHPECCKGCRKCVKACPEKAISPKQTIS